MFTHELGMGLGAMRDFTRYRTFTPMFAMSPYQDQQIFEDARHTLEVTRNKRLTHEQEAERVCTKELIEFLRTVEKSEYYI